MKKIPVNIEALIRERGIELDKNADLPSGILGEIRKKGDGYKISIQSFDHYYRRRFTMAHELAHYELHREKLGNGVDDSESYISVFKRSEGITSREEAEANDWAAKILMPEDSVIEEVSKEELFKAGSNQPDVDVIKKISKIFQVSPKAMAIRLGNLVRENKIKINQQT